MSKNKIEIKPMYIAFIGLVIIVLGVLIPSFFISAFSTIGFAVIIGLLLLLTAYMFFAVNMVKSQGKKTIKWLMSPFIIAMLIGGGFFANNKYNDYLNNKIYSVEDNVDFSDFMLKVSRSSYSKPLLNVPQEKISAFGGIDSFEDCSKYPYLSWDNSDVDITSFSYDNNAYEKAHPSARYCEWRNDSRKIIQAYTAENNRLSIDYEITANKAVDSKDIKVSIMLDSGRDASKPASQFDYDPLLSPKYHPAFDYEYKPYTATAVGGNINKGITRKQNISFDVRNNEKTIDTRVDYKGQTRLVRITR